MWLAKAEGRAAWRRLSAAVAAGRPPGREVIDGALVLVGGLLLIVPGFITDAVGLLLLAPTRAVARRAHRPQLPEPAGDGRHAVLRRAALGL